jgi:hypothetical protein
LLQTTHETPRTTGRTFKNSTHCTSISRPDRKKQSIIISSRSDGEQGRETVGEAADGGGRHGVLAAEVPLLDHPGDVLVLHRDLRVALALRDEGDLRGSRSCGKMERDDGARLEVLGLEELGDLLERLLLVVLVEVGGGEAVADGALQPYCEPLISLMTTTRSSFSTGDETRADQKAASARSSSAVLPFQAPRWPRRVESVVWR